MKISLDRLARVGFVSAVIITCAIFLLQYRSARSLIEVTRKATEARRVSEMLGEVLLHSSRAESAARGYLMSGEDRYLPAFEESMARLRRINPHLEELVAADPEQAERLRSLESVVERQMTLLSQKVEMRKQGNLQAALQVFRSGEDARLADRIQEVVAEMRSRQRTLLGERELQARADAQKSLDALMIGAAIGITILVLVFYYLNREAARRKRTEAGLIHSNRLYAVLSHISDAMVRCRERDRLFEEVCRIAVQQGSFLMAWIGLASPETGKVIPVAHAGKEEGYLSKIRITVREEADPRDPAVLTVRKGEPLVCNDLRTDPRCLSWREESEVRGYRSAVALPVTLKDQVIGAFTVYSSTTGFFNHEVVNLLSEVASGLSFALELIGQEEQVRRLNEDLERRVEERTTQLAALNTELEERNSEVERANKLKSEFLATMSHELRTPLNAIIGFSDLLAEERSGALQEKYRRYVRHIQTGARHLLELINDILDVSRIEEGRIELSAESFNAAESVAEVLSLLRPLALSKQIAVRDRVEGDLVLYADRTRFKQILYNLVSNAVKFTPEGGSVTLEASSDGEGATFSVTDTGVGIPAGERAAIFDKFYQVGTTTSGVKEGSGLGLAITRGLVQMHGGKIWVESTVGSGSRFTFSLPGAALSPLSASRSGSRAAAPAWEKNSNKAASHERMTGISWPRS